MKKLKMTRHNFELMINDVKELTGISQLINTRNHMRLRGIIKTIEYMFNKDAIKDNSPRKIACMALL